MAAKAQILSALAVQRLKSPGLHFVGGVAGLALQVLKSGGRSWILRVTIGGKRRDMGLGGYPDVTLSEARAAARLARAKIRAGTDPITERKAAKSALIKAQGRYRSFRQCAENYISGHEQSWKSLKHQRLWTQSLVHYVYPKIGQLAVQDVDLTEVLAVLEPIWTTKTETAKRLRGRIEVILDAAITRGYRTGPNPARWRGHLDKILPAPGKLRTRQHFPALHPTQMADFMIRLRTTKTVAAQALEFLILTATRSAEVRGARWEEIDLARGIWTIPAERMKAGREHRVPLSADAQKLLHEKFSGQTSGLVFPAPRSKGILSDVALLAVARKNGQGAVTVHGFRSSFRDWASECTNYPRDVCEMALAHAIANKVEAAYRRGDLFLRRKVMMEDWANFCARPSAEQKSPEVTFFRPAASK